jgi:hypothetical protein
MTERVVPSAVGVEREDCTCFSPLRGTRRASDRGYGNSDVGVDLDGWVVN